ncbi:MAG: hypothetical protein U9N04_00355 [Patescibacteria group bacterium]|nr:hypothetical protein [Patescibacteria group bacterium]
MKENYWNKAFLLRKEIQEERIKGNLENIPEKVEELKSLFCNEREQLIVQEEVFNMLFFWLFQEERDIRLLAAEIIAKDLVSVSQTHILHISRKTRIYKE